MIETIEAICEEVKLKPCVPIDRFEGKRAVVFFFLMQKILIWMRRLYCVSGFCYPNRR